MLTMQKVTILDSRCDRHLHGKQNKKQLYQQTNFRTRTKKVVPISTKKASPIRAIRSNTNYKIKNYYHFFALTNAKWCD